MFFDLLIDPKDESKALAIYNRSLRTCRRTSSGAHRALCVFAAKTKQAEERASSTARPQNSLRCRARRRCALLSERMAQLEPENLSRQVKLAEVAERNKRNTLAARALLRAVSWPRERATDASLNYLARAHALAPQDGASRFCTRCEIAKGRCGGRGEIARAIRGNGSHPVFLETFSEALVRSGQLDRARGCSKSCCEIRMPDSAGYFCWQISTRQQAAAKQWKFSRF